MTVLPTAAGAAPWPIPADAHHVPDVRQRELVTV